MAAWQSGTHGEAAGTLACTGPSIASSALRFVGRAGTLTMTSGSPTSVMAPGSHTTQLARGQRREKKKKMACLTPRAKSYLCCSIMTRGPRRKTTTVAGTEGVQPPLAASFQTTEERVIIAPRFTPKAPLSLNQ